MYQKLRKLRNERNYTTEEMAKMLGISKPYYSQLENQVRRLSYDMAIKIAYIFDKKPDDIFYEQKSQRS